MGNVQVDLSSWPIVVLTNEGEMGPQDTLRFLSGFDDAIRRKERYVSVIDSSKLSTFRMGDRDRIVTWMKDNDAALRKYSVGTAVVMSSAALRFVISSVLLVYKPASPIKVFSSLTEAMGWAKAQAQSLTRASPA